jgi:flagellar hook-associated protein 2
VTQQVSSLVGTKYDSLSAIGVTTDSSGKLTIDSAKLTSALEDNAGNVAKVFTADDGLSAALVDKLEPYTQSAGILSARTDGINQSIKGIDNRISGLELRVESYESNLIRQFAAMEDAISRINLQGQYLSRI